MEPTDDDLMLQLARGRAPAAAALVARHRRRLLGYLARLMGSLESAEDLFQETFVRLYEERGSFRPQGRFASFLFTIATHLAYRELSRQGRFQFVSLDEPAVPGEASPARVERVPCPREGPEEVAMRRDLRSTIEAGLATLPHEYRSALILREVEGLAYEEIANVIGLPVGTVRSRIHRGRRLLAAYLTGQGAAEARSAG